MFSDRKSNFIARGIKCNLTNEEKNGSDNLESSNKFSSDCVVTCQISSLLSLNEKRNKLLKLLEEDSVKDQEMRENVSEEDKNLSCEEAEELLKLPLEALEVDSEEEEEEEEGGGGEEDNGACDWREIDENQCTLDDICGLNEIKESLFNILIYPSLYPQFFPKRIRWNQILLYGPPGTGKTMLAKALAFEINAALHRITSADLLSHWQGQTERQIKNLFQEIQSNSEPQILFFDEIDGLFRKRTNDESDSTRRVKTEFLIHLDDFTGEFGNHQTFLIGATNCPWEIDSSFMRRFHKKIFVPLPDKKARLDIIKKSFENIETDLTDSEWSDIGDATEGYSGSDLVNVVMNACCVRFMEVKTRKHWEIRGGYAEQNQLNTAEIKTLFAALQYESLYNVAGDFWVPVSSSSLLSTEMNFEDIHPEKIGFRNIILSDLMEAIGKTPKSVEPELLLKYLEFSEKK